MDSLKNNFKPALNEDEPIDYRQKRLDLSAKSKLNFNTDLKPNCESNPDFKNFLGYWIRETMDDWMMCTMIQFYEENGNPKAKFFDGTQNHLREVTLADVGAALDLGGGDLCAIPQDNYDVIYDTCDVEVLDSQSLFIMNTFHQGYLSSDQLQSTFKIQSYDNNVAFSQLWTIWDGTSDNKEYGELENLSKFRRLDYVPEIQTRNQLTNKWNNAVNIFNYMYDVYTHLGSTQRRDADQCDQYIGNVAFAQLRDQLLSTGVVRTNTISTAKKNGKYIGVWRTKGSGSRDTNTTLRLKDTNYFTICDKVTISGFLGAYAVMNGQHDVSFLTKGSVGPQYGKEWVLEDSTHHAVHIMYNSSSISEEYDPTKHGVATLTTQHGPVTPQTEYRELMGAVADLMLSFGTATHTSLYMYSTAALGRINTYAELQAALAVGNYSYVTVPRRPRGQKQGRDILYFNPVLRRGNRASPIFDINDPYGLGPIVRDATTSSKWNIDIDLKNYMEVSYNIWFAITGPVLPEEPVTGQLVDQGYPNNGSQIRFTVAETGQVPPNLVDEFGSHKYMPYQYSTNNAFVGGIVNREYTNSCHKPHKKAKSVAYIRIASEGGFDGNTLSFRTLPFGRNDWPGYKFRSNEVAAMAALLEKLNEYKPQKYILDIRENGGGVGSYGGAWASLFGGNRSSTTTEISLDVANDVYSSVRVTGSTTIETVNGSLDYNTKTGALVDTDATAAHFPKAMVRGKCGKSKDVIILDNIGAGSAGDMFPHNFIGSDKEPKDGIHDIGHHVRCQIVGDLDGRLYNGLSYGATPVSNPNRYTDGTYQYALIPFSYDGGIFQGKDRHGQVCNQQTWTQPSKLVPSWFEKMWQDIGVIEPLYKYPLKSKTEVPNIDDNKTWRDLALEHAITK